MDWTQVMAIIGANIVLMISMIGIMIKLHLHTDKTIKSIHDEMKDFHGRLISLEEKTRAQIYGA